MLYNKCDLSSSIAYSRYAFSLSYLSTSYRISLAYFSFVFSSVFYLTI